MLDAPKILVVDDEPICLDHICRYLDGSGSGYEIVKAENGDEALAALHQSPTDWDLVLLDKFMDGMDGMTVLSHIKSDPNLKVLPVILQTSDTSPDKLLEGIRAGAYYYLTKPFSREELQAVVANALNQYRFTRLAQEALSNLKTSLYSVNEISLNFRSREDVHQTTALMPHISSLTMAQEMGLIELMLNAVEHGNLAITYDEKTQLINEGRLESEITDRLGQPEFSDKSATLHFRKSHGEYHFTITDEGKGFD
jgi:CheY-like chemotaxis protein